MGCGVSKFDGEEALGPAYRFNPLRGRIGDIRRHRADRDPSSSGDNLSTKQLLDDRTTDTDVESLAPYGDRMSMSLSPTPKLVNDNNKEEEEHTEPGPDSGNNNSRTNVDTHGGREIIPSPPQKCVEDTRHQFDQYAAPNPEPRDDWRRWYVQNTRRKEGQFQNGLDIYISADNNKEEMDTRHTSDSGNNNNNSNKPRDVDTLDGCQSNLLPPCQRVNETRRQDDRYAAPKPGPGKDRMTVPSPRSHVYNTRRKESHFQDGPETVMEYSATYGGRTRFSTPRMVGDTHAQAEQTVAKPAADPAAATAAESSPPRHSTAGHKILKILQRSPMRRVDDTRGDEIRSNFVAIMEDRATKGEAKEIKIGNGNANDEEDMEEEEELGREVGPASPSFKVYCGGYASSVSSDEDNENDGKDESGLKVRKNKSKLEGEDDESLAPLNSSKDSQQQPAGRKGRRLRGLKGVLVLPKGGSVAVKNLWNAAPCYNPHSPSLRTDPQRSRAGKTT